MHIFSNHPHVRGLSMPIDVFADGSFLTGRAEAPAVNSLFQFSHPLLLVHCSKAFNINPGIRPSHYYMDDKGYESFGRTFSEAGKTFYFGHYLAEEDPPDEGPEPYNYYISEGRDDNGFGNNMVASGFTPANQVVVELMKRGYRQEWVK